jgi:hypothetical protein
MFSGYKTYILAASTVIGAVASYLVGDIQLIDAIQLVVPALAGAFVRNAL